ncbi:DUF1684 domain-containing protein [Cryobacterium sp. TMT1-21]|uniref:DUF1684 domain-containing protein n=1 Tax=Cryobacterium shii TaxID=1259235 RepID=A0AAQ2C6D5_9MICO|nr:MULTISPECIES: DUF1684 domain-containing protein [Cryobacterium]TFC47079.1 DUF1684 domain-containing protein [Cryobacterium shii]TFC88184.1 DUF1684 domain-containing protein [Cryobacterium sp. TmT2-59]TFD08562.1 DUF1684 domain-containing protein [Cryobacterium sp. TMT1-21]TFD17152.1 DUF1684 domain-containing protein [Cryobacterium sp. TMT2-23]TFD17294.1 DUF1684 domain-containing protein [Cryobacterium sp. TMT4-10]
MSTTLGALQVADWRRRVFGLYAGVRQISAHDPAAGHELWRSGRDDLFAGHPSSPLLPDDRAVFTGLPVAAYDPDWRFEVEVHRAEQPVHIAVDTGTDGKVPFDLVGSVRLPYLGAIDLWRLSCYGGGLFLPFRDGLAGKPGGTYGGGRYLLDTVKGADLGAGADDNTLILDFNFAYNPSCAYDPMWACPLPQAGNIVTAEVPVGELSPGEERHPAQLHSRAFDPEA